MSFNEKQLRQLEYGAPELTGDRGLRARKQKDGSVSFILQKRMRGRKSPIRHKLGSWPDMPIDDAIVEASRCRKLIDAGVHPSEEAQRQLEERLLEQHTRNAAAYTLNQLLEAYQESRETYGRGNAPRTMADREQTIRLVFNDRLHQPVAEITKTDIETKFREWAIGRGSREQAKKAMRYLRSLLNYAKDRLDIIESNPVDSLKSVISLSSSKNFNHLKQSECVELLDLLLRLSERTGIEPLLKAPHPLSDYELGDTRRSMYDAIALMLLSGLRRREILQLTWDHIYLTEAEWAGNNANGPYFWIITSKQKQPFGVPITQRMETIFQRRKRSQNSRFVFPSPRPDIKGEAPLDNERAAYATLARLMECESFKATERLSANVLRTTFATTAYGMGHTFEQIGLYTGHTGAISNSKVATDAYVVVNADNHREAFERINRGLLGTETVYEEVDGNEYAMINNPPRGFLEIDGLESL